MIPALSDPSLTHALGEKGYFKCPLLSPDEVARLSAAYEAIQHPATRGFHASMFAQDAEYRRTIFTAIAAVMAAPCARWLPGYQLRVANFIVKEGGASDSVVPFHQDWSFVDETRFVSLNVWCPLVDVGSDNGCLSVIPGSHRLTTQPRAHADAHPFVGILDQLRERHICEVPMKAGEGLIYDGRLLHGSPPNQTNTRRVSVGVVMIPDEAPILHAFRISPTEVEQFEVNGEFFHRHIPGTRPVGAQSHGIVSAPLRQFSSTVLMDLDGSATTTKPYGITS